MIMPKCLLDSDYYDHWKLSLYDDCDDEHEDQLKLFSEGSEYGTKNQKQDATRTIFQREDVSTFQRKEN